MPRDANESHRRDLSQEFHEADHPDPSPPDSPEWGHDDDRLDHLEYTLDYTPGGSIEQLVNTQLSEQARAAYRARQQPVYEDGSEYERQIDRQFERAAANDEAQRVADAQREEKGTEEPFAVDERGSHGLDIEPQGQRRRETDRLVAEAEREPTDWHDDPAKAAEYGAWLKEQEFERSEAEHEQMLDRIQARQLEQDDARPADVFEPQRGEEGPYPRLYRGPNQELTAEWEAAGAAEWESEAGLRDAWDRTASPDLSNGDTSGSTGHGSGGHEH